MLFAAVTIAGFALCFFIGWLRISYAFTCVHAGRQPPTTFAALAFQHAGAFGVFAAWFTEISFDGWTLVWDSLAFVVGSVLTIVSLSHLAAAMNSGPLKPLTEDELLRQAEEMKRLDIEAEANWMREQYSERHGLPLGARNYAELEKLKKQARAE